MACVTTGLLFLADVLLLLLTPIIITAVTASITASSVHLWYLCQISLQIMLLPILVIHVSYVIVMQTYIILFESAVRYSYSSVCFSQIVYIWASWTMATSFAHFVYYNSCIIRKIVNCHANVIILFWECGQILIRLQGTKNLHRSQIVSGLLECFWNRLIKQKCLSFFVF